MGDSFARNSLAPGVFRVSSSFPRFTLAPVRSFPRSIEFPWRFPAAFSWRKRHRDNNRAGDDAGVGRRRETKDPLLLEIVRLLRVLRPTEPGPSDRWRCPATSSVSAGSFLSRWTSFCSCHLSYGLLSLALSAHSFSRSRPLTLSRSSRGDTRSAPAVHRYALGSGGSRV